MTTRHLRSAWLVACAVLLVGCSASEPTVSCDETTWSPPSPLRCEDAIDAALAALPDDGTEPTRITFLYGNYCLPGRECPTSPDVGVVIFEFPWPTSSLYVEVVPTTEGVQVQDGPSPAS